MPRAQSTDFFHAMRFHVTATGRGGSGQTPFGVQGGFTTCVMPEHTIELVEYKEGIYVYRRKFPGDTTVSDITLTRGVVKAGTELFKWILDTTFGREYRVDMTIRHFHRDDVVGLADYTSAKPSRTIDCFECFPIRVKPGSDFDGQSSEISLQEIDIAVERFTITPGGQP